MTLKSSRLETSACDALLAKYADKLEVNPELDRSLVSFQANKREPFYRWFKFKEGFSSSFVRYCVKTMKSHTGVLLDPFAGSGSALFAARDLGWDTIGIEILPVGFYAIEARQSIDYVDFQEFSSELERLAGVRLDEFYDSSYALRHIPITEGAFPPATERQLAGYLAFCDNQISDPHIRKLFEFACFCTLEEISFTRKDGQYLRWDYRSPKRRGKTAFDKGTIRPFRDAMLRKLGRIAEDLAEMVADKMSRGQQRRGMMDVRRGSSLRILPDMPSNDVDFVVTSPPYCNRYDYTRTYALELVFLGCGEEYVKNLRQEMLSCTVENKGKLDELRSLYQRHGRLDHFDNIAKVFQGQEALQQVLQVLEAYRASGKLNNSNIARMVRNYFYEMCFVISELARILRPGGKIVMVNDNVRYAGVEIPVDLILSDIAAAFGLRVAKIWTLPRGKGNSSQQMGSHGRRELRKCVYIWDK